MNEAKQFNYAVEPELMTNRLQSDTLFLHKDIFCMLHDYGNH